MSNFEELIQAVLGPVSILLAKALGDKCEVIVCWLTEEKTLRIAFSENSSPEHNVGFIYEGIDIDTLLRSENKYIETLIVKGGEYIRSTTASIHGAKGIMGTITINSNVTNLVFVQNQLQGITKYIPESAENESIEDISELGDHMLAHALKVIGKPVTHMKKEDKKEFIRYLDKRGYFQIKKSTEKVAQYLDISKFTLYTCLEDIRSADYDDNAAMEHD